MQSHEEQNIELKLNAVTEVQFMMKPDKLDDSDLSDKLRVGFSNRIVPFTEDDQISIEFGVGYLLKDEIILESRYRFSFSVKNLSSYVTKNQDGSITITQIMPHLLSVASGTMRGIIVVKAAGTNFAKYPLPIIDIEELCRNLSSEAH